MRGLLVAAAIALGGCVFGSTAPAPQRAHPKLPTRVLDTDSIGVTWIGHATVLLRLGDRWILTDPILGRRIAGLVPRQIAAGIDPRELPPIDAVLISHAHFDHLDAPSLARVTPGAVLVPPGAAKFIPRLHRPRTVPLRTWQTWSRDGLTITAVPASHGDGRYLVDFWNRATHTGYVIQYRGLTVYFAGDTGYIARDAALIHGRFAIDVALIPVGPAGRAKWIEDWRADVHVTPDAAMDLFRTSGAQWMVPIHFGAFYKNIRDELPLVHRAIDRAHLRHRVRVLEVGETTEFLY
ncbi:MAG: MBL fold metallo-hydrolase [Deltaproteobacteria bacterium]|nr:MBL fold metallo-hydrolase [Deltaproteobacteria bacterium]